MSFFDTQDYDDRLLSSISDSEYVEVSMLFWGTKTPRLHVYAGKNIVDDLILKKAPMSEKMAERLKENPLLLDSVKSLLIQKGFKLPN